jgi:hypothetical protein
MKMKNAKIVRLAPLFLPLFTLGEIHGLPNRIASNPIALSVAADSVSVQSIVFMYCSS